MNDSRLSPLHDRHVALGAKFSEFGGWQMPLQYSGVVAEHKRVRSAVGVFDVSHLGKLWVRGEGAADFLNRCLSNDLGRITAGHAQYTLACNADGGVVDDLIAYRLSDDEMLLIPNAANAAAVNDLLAADLPAGIEIHDGHTEYAVIAVQGPLSDETLAALGLPVGHDYMAFAPGTWGGASLTVCRTGYTGERGYELVIPAEAAGRLWDAVLAAGAEYDILPAGLGARDTLRTEMGYPLHGQDLSPSITAVQAGVGWAVGWSKPEFWGAEALKAERAVGATRLLRGLKSTGRGIPRPHMAVVDEAGGHVGEVTSGTFSPTLGVGIGLALIDRSVPLGARIGVMVRSRTEEFEVVKPPFVTPSVRQA
ncbi:MAG: glycine cleavage system aminomethyltransferase GcvT [Propionibacteriaceae bacterium]|nr:glycine cleavage system aminomethyltransferase GcvT [Propionibacteriaceae bacterium]